MTPSLIWRTSQGLPCLLSWISTPSSKVVSSRRSQRHPLHHITRLIHSFSPLQTRGFQQLLASLGLLMHSGRQSGRGLTSPPATLPPQSSVKRIWQTGFLKASAFSSQRRLPSCSLAGACESLAYHRASSQLEGPPHLRLDSSSYQWWFPYSSFQRGHPCCQCLH